MVGGLYLFLTPVQRYKETRACHARVSSAVLINVQQITEIYVIFCKVTASTRATLDVVLREVLQDNRLV